MRLPETLKIQGGDLTWLPAAALVTAGASVALLSAGTRIVTPLIFAFPLVLLWAVRHRLEPVLRSPVWVTVLVLWVLGVAGFALHAQVAGQSGASISISLDDSLASLTVRLIGISIAWLAIGATAVVLLIPKPATASKRLLPIATTERVRAWMLPAAFIPLALVIGGGGVGSLLYRTTYFTKSDGSSIASFGAQLGIAAIAALGYLTATHKGWRRAVAVLGVILYILVFFAFGSRRLTLAPVCFTLGLYVATMSWKSKLGVMAGALISIPLLPLPLYLRGLPEHGIIPYSASLTDFLATDHSWLGTLNNVLVFFPITALTAFDSAPIPLSSILIELNPLPGQFTGWYSINQEMGLNRYTPFSGIGELGNAGPLVVAIVWMSIGAVLAYLDGQVRAMVNSGKQVAAVAVVGLAALFAVAVAQYNLRNAQRSLVYAVLLCIVLQVVENRRQVRLHRKAELQAQEGGEILVQPSGGRVREVLGRQDEVGTAGN